MKGKIQAILSFVSNRVYEHWCRRRLQNNEFSIICSNCIGGLIYHRLGKAFLSPTINLWINQQDFLRFVLDMDTYLKQELVFIESKYNYPVALLKDVTIYFVHYKSPEEAKACWERRKTRINYENLFIIMYDRDGITEEDIRKLEQVRCKGKVVLSDRRLESIDYALQLIPSQNPNGKQCVDADWLGIKTFEKQFDFVKWLNKGCEE